MEIKALVFKIDAEIDQLLLKVKLLEAEREELLSENFELRADADAMRKIHHEQRKEMRKQPIPLPFGWNH